MPNGCLQTREDGDRQEENEGTGTEVGGGEANYDFFKVPVGAAFDGLVEILIDGLTGEG